MKENDRLSALEWLALADYDLKMAEWAEEGKFWAGACFHAQQAAEKALKAFLTFHRIVPKKIHSLAILSEECASIDSALTELSEELKTLDKYYIATRYPVHFPKDYTKDDAEEAIQIARQATDLIKNKIEIESHNT